MAVYTLAATGNWNSAATWGGSGFPIAGDTANITGNFTLTVNVASACAIVDFTGFTGTLTVNNTLTVTGNITFVNGFTINTTSGTPALTKTTGGTLTMPAAGFTWPYAINFAGGSTYTLSTGDLTINGTLTGTGSGTATINGAGINLNVKSVTATAAIGGTVKVRFTQTGGTWSGVIGTTGGVEIAIAATANPDLTLTSARYQSGTLTYTSGNMGVQNLIILASVTFVNISSITFNTLTVGLAGSGVTTILTADGDITCTSLVTAATNVGQPSVQINSSSTNFNIYCSNLTFFASLQSATYTIVMNGTGNIGPAAGALSGDSRNFLSIPLTISTTGTLTFATNTTRFGSNTGVSLLIKYISGTIDQSFSGTMLAISQLLATLDTSGFEWPSMTIGVQEPTVGNLTLLSDLRVRNFGISNGPNSGNFRAQNSGGDIYISGNLTLSNGTLGLSMASSSTGTTASINMVGSGTILVAGTVNTAFGSHGFRVPLIINTSGKYVIQSTLADTQNSFYYTNSFVKSGIFTFLKGKVEVERNTKILVGVYQNAADASTFTNMHRIPFNSVYIAPTSSYTANEFFCGKPGKYCIVASTTTTNATINFTDGFEKFARWVKPSNITIAQRGQAKLLSSLGNRDRTNLGFTYFEGAQPYSVPHNNPIAYHASPCYGVADSPVDPNFFKS